MEAAKSKADVLVTGDVKYHDAVDMLEIGMCVIDAGHLIRKGYCRQACTTDKREFSRS